MNSTRNSKKIYEALVWIAILVFSCGSANGETLYAQSVLHEIGGWANVGDLRGSPDGQYAYTANSLEQPWAWASLSSGSAVWLDFGRVVHSGTIVVYHDDPGGHYTDLVVSPWYGFCPGVPWPVPLVSDSGCIQGNIQGSGTVTCYTTPFDFRYVRLNHFTLDSSLQDGIDAVAVIEGAPSGVGIDLDPPPAIEGPAVYAAGQSNNGYWNNPGAVLGAPDGVYAWSSNPSHTMPHLVVDLGRVVYSGTIVIHHDKTHLLKTGLGVSINSQEYDPDPETCPAWPYNMDEWEALWTGNAEGVTTLQFPPTSFRYIQLGQSQCYPGREDGIDAVEVYESPPLGATIQGLVSEPDGVSPIAGATLLLKEANHGDVVIDPYDSDGDDDEYTLHTGVNGQFLIGGLEAGTFELLVWADRNGFSGSRRLANIALETGQIYDVTLSLPRILPVPYYRQGEAAWCSPSSLSMLLSYRNVLVKPWQIAAHFGLNAAKGLQTGHYLSEVPTYVGQFGLTSEYIIGLPLHERVVQEIDWHRPLIAGIRTTVDDEEGGHHFVVVGYDEDRIYLHDPGEVIAGISNPVAYSMAWEDYESKASSSSFGFVVGGIDTWQGPFGSIYTYVTSQGARGNDFEISFRKVSESRLESVLQLALDGRRQPHGYGYVIGRGFHPRYKVDDLDFAARVDEAVDWRLRITNPYAHAMTFVVDAVIKEVSPGSWPIMLLPAETKRIDAFSTDGYGINMSLSSLTPDKRYAIEIHLTDNGGTGVDQCSFEFYLSSRTVGKD